MTLTQLVSASFYLLTAILLAYAVGHQYVRTGRLCAVGAILTGLGANGFLWLSYEGEPPVVYERPGPLKRARAGERGAFEFEENGEAAGGGRARAGSGSGTGAVTMVSSNDSISRKAERQLMHGLGCASCPDMVVIRPGVFRMGADPADEAATESERPTRMIGISAPFAIGRNEVTLREYAVFAKATRRSLGACLDLSGEEDPDLPVTCVSPRDADAYATWLAVRTGKPFRLPSEAEWEFAARAGATDAYVTGSQLGNGDANVGRADGTAVRVGSYPANAFGLNDIHGNAAEIVAGCWVASPDQLPGDGTAATTVARCSNRVLRDGHAGEPATMARLSARRPIDRGARLPGVGFRLARDLQK
jgi:formylglycine-generating enzyme required for sulfatase activity